jgi:hypothetical protein
MKKMAFHEKHIRSNLSLANPSCHFQQQPGKNINRITAKESS